MSRSESERLNSTVEGGKPDPAGASGGKAGVKSRNRGRERQWRHRVPMTSQRDFIE